MNKFSRREMKSINEKDAEREREREKGGERSSREETQVGFNEGGVVGDTKSF